MAGRGSKSLGTLCVQLRALTSVLPAELASQAAQGHAPNQQQSDCSEEAPAADPARLFHHHTVPSLLEWTRTAQAGAQVGRRCAQASLKLG